MAHLLPQPRFLTVGRRGGIHLDLIDHQFPVVGRERGMGMASHYDQQRQGGTKRALSPARDQARAKRSKQTCPVQGCGHASSKVKWHVFGHLPDCFRTSGTLTGPRWTTIMRLRVEW